MKLPSPPAFAALGLVLSLGLSACATPSNERALYFPGQYKGPWHDYEQRQIVAAQLNVTPGELPPPVRPPAATPTTLPNPTAPSMVPVPASLPPTTGAAAIGPVSGSQ